VTERIQAIELPEFATAPTLGPISSIMGEIMFVALSADPREVSGLELRRAAELLVRRRLLPIPGIAQVTPIGGDVREIQVEVDPIALRQSGVGLDEVAVALREGSHAAAAGFHVRGDQEYLVRGLGRVRSTEDLAAQVIRVVDGVPILIEDIGRVVEGSEPRRGTASYGASPAVVLSIQKQPGANTLELTREIERVLAEVASSLPAGITLESESFRQADFIEVAVRNVTHALRDGGLLVVAVLFLFLGSVRTTLISAIAMPLSLLTGLVALGLFGATVNTMTLGGFTIAVGALVDDAIIDVENVFRRLKEELRKPLAERRPLQEVVFQGSSEVRRAILFATLIIGLVFLPLFFLPGMEGRLLQPLGLAYLIALGASLLVSLTVTPALCLILLRDEKLLQSRETPLLRFLRARYEKDLGLALRRPGWTVGGTVLLLIAALALIPLLDRAFLPPFNEGALTVSVVSPAGVALEVSDALGREVELALLAVPEVISTSRRTGRAEKDEHVQGVNASEMEVVLREGREREEVLSEMRAAVAMIPGVAVSFGQPISHRIDHMISGSKSSLAVKIFGPDLAVLRGLARRIDGVLREVEGIVDLSNAEQSSVPQILIEFDRRAMAYHGIRAESLARAVEAAFQGATVGEITEGSVVSRVALRLRRADGERRERLEDIPVVAADGVTLRLGDLAHVREDLGPSLIRREDVQRVAVLTANVASSDLAGVVDAARTVVAKNVPLPPGYRVAFSGQFEEAARSARNLAILSTAALAGIYGLLYLAFRSHRNTWIVLVNLPLAMIGGIVGISLGSGVASVASLVGFITLFGIAARNGVLLVMHYQHLMTAEGLTRVQAVERGSPERLAPVLMTALCAGLALIPLVLAGGKPGNEIQSPMGEVILGGLLSSTLLNLVIVPILFARWGVGGTRSS